MKTKPNRLLACAVACVAASSAGTFEIQAQEITPVWVQHLNKTDNLLPILRKNDGDTERADGTSSFDNYVAFVRYDATRLLLGVRENGINESDPALSAADKALAAQYPDRSIIWINPTNGAPMGVAHKVPVFPVELAPDAQGSPNDFFWNWGIDEGAEGQRAIYTTYKHIILRWAPVAGGGWSTTPTVAWTEPVPNEPTGDGSSGGDGSVSWRWRTFRVVGSGLNTEIYAGGATWRSSMHVQKFITKDGSKFEPAARVNDRDGGVKGRYSFSGMNTKAVKYAKDPSRPNLELFFSPSFPASGRELKPRRFSRNPDSTRSGSFTEAAPAAQQINRNNFFDPDSAASGGLPAFRWEGDEAPFPSGTQFYDGNWSYAMDTGSGLDYLVNYSGPSWNNQYGPNERRPGWLGIHRLSGRIASGSSSYKFDFDEQTEVTLDAVGAGNSYTYDGNVNVYPDPTSPANVQKAEVLWAGGSFGFGVFTVQNTPATLVSSPASQTATAGATVTLTADVTGSPNEFQWYRNGRPLPDASYYKGATKAVLTITGVTPADQGTYQLRWTNPISGAGQTTPATLTVSGNFVRWTEASPITPVGAEVIAGEVVTNATSFVLKTGGGSAFDKVDDVGNSTGDGLFFRYENVTGDFDKQVRLVSLSTDPAPTETADRFARAGLLLRESKDSRAQALEIAAAHPDGNNLVRVAGRGRFNQIYSRRLSRDYAGVKDNLPNQWLRVRRVGNAFAFYVGKDGQSWSLIAEQYQVLPETLLVGTFASTDNPDSASIVSAEFANYGDVVVTDTVAPTLVSVGTIDNKTIGVKFSEPVDSRSASRLENYSISAGALLNARVGISGNTVYLGVTGLTANSFDVTVNGGVVDLAGNLVAAGSKASGKKSDWTSTDIGYIQDPANRPTPGDDPYPVGQAVAVSSDPNPEIEIVGGGSNAYNIGDYMHYLYKSYTGDFDVAVAIDRFDRRGIAGGYANAGLHIRSGLYRTDNTEIGETTKVPSYVNITYYEGSDPNRAAIELNRPAAGDNYGNSGPYANTTEVGGLLGYFTGLRAINAAGDLDPLSSPTQAKWLRVKRVGQSFTSYFSYDGVTWQEQADSTRVMANLPATVLVGVGNQNDSGYGIPPNNTYAGNGTLNADGLPTQNESNYGVVRVRGLGNYPPPAGAPTLSIARNGATAAITFEGTLQSATSVTGPFSDVAGAASPYTPPAGASAQFYRARR